MTANLGGVCAVCGREFGPLRCVDHSILKTSNDALRARAESAEAEVERLTAGWAAQMAAPCPVCAPVFAEVERLRAALADLVKYTAGPPDAAFMAARQRAVDALGPTAAKKEEPT